jgi:hypothetical protein
LSLRNWATALRWLPVSGCWRNSFQTCERHTIQLRQMSLRCSAWG